MVQGRPKPGTAQQLVWVSTFRKLTGSVAKQHFCQNLHLLACMGSIADTQSIFFQHKQKRLESTEFNHLNKFCWFSNGLRPKCHSASALHLDKHWGCKAWAGVNGPSAWMGMIEGCNPKPNLKSKALSVNHHFGYEERTHPSRCLNCQGDPY